LQEVANFIEPFRQMWETRFNQLERVLAANRGRRR
jgi:hypothetical protein